MIRLTFVITVQTSLIADLRSASTQRKAPTANTDSACGNPDPAYA